jgi:cytochrome c-type biogenesis protein CcmH/NrfG
VRLDPQLVDAWSILIRLLAALGDAEGAVAAYTGGVAADPGHPSLLAVRPAGAR